MLYERACAGDVENLAEYGCFLSLHPPQTSVTAFSGIRNMSESPASGIRAHLLTVSSLMFPKYSKES